MTDASREVASDARTGDEPGGRLRYRLLTGPDDHDFCVRVSRVLDDGYVLHGSPAIAVGPEGPVVCQAVILA